MLSRSSFLVLASALISGAVGCNSTDRGRVGKMIEYEKTSRPAPTGPHAVGREEVILVDPSRSIRYDYDEARGINQITAVSPLGTYRQVLDPTQSALANKPTKVFFAPSEPDPYSWELTSQTDVDRDNPRELRVVLHYPTDRERYVGLQPLYSEFLTEQLSGDHGVLDLLDEATAYVAPGIPPVGGKGELPVAMFVSGLGVETELYQTYPEELASHGYLVVSINAPFWGGPHENYAKAGKEPTFRPASAIGGMMNGMYNEASAFTFFDASFVLDALEKNDRYDRADFDNVYFFGHSYGSEMGSGAMMKDKRIAALCLVDGILYPDNKEVQARSSTPIFAMSSNSYGMSAKVFEPYAKADGSMVTYLYFAAAGHMSYSSGTLYSSASTQAERDVNVDTMVKSRKAILAFFESVRGGTYGDFAGYLRREFPDHISGNSARLLIDFSIR